MAARDPDALEGGLAKLGRVADAIEGQERILYPLAKCIIAWLLTAAGIVVAIISGGKASKDESALPWVRAFAVANVLMGIWANLSARSLRYYAPCRESLLARVLVTVGAVIWMALTIMFFNLCFSRLTKAEIEA